MIDGQDLLNGGGVLGVITAVGYVIQQVLKGRQERQARKDAEPSTLVTDAATANALLLNSLAALQESNAKLIREANEDRERLDALERSRDEDHRVIAGLRVYIHSLVSAMKRQNMDVPQAPAYLDVYEGG